MKHIKLLSILIGVCLVLVLALTPLMLASAKPASTPPPGLAGKADMILYNGKIITVDEDFSIAEAAAICDGKFIAVGSQGEVMGYQGPETEMIDLEGETVLPGINESHIHFQGFGLSRPPLVLDVGFPTVHSIAEIVAMVGERVGEVSPGEWITGRGYDPGYLDEIIADPDRRPTRWDLDPVSPDNPVALSDMSGHTGWYNSKAFELAGITKDTPDPEGGVIVRDPVTGEPTGILHEKAKALVSYLIPPPSEERQIEAIITAMEELNSFGITSVTEPGCSARKILQYHDLCLEDKLTIRVNLMVRGGSSLEAMQENLSGLAGLARYTGFGGDELIRIKGVKLMADGVPPALTAWMYEEYPGHPGVYGGLVVAGATPEEQYDELISMIVYAHQQGYQVGIHTCGDRAIDAVVDGFIQAIGEYPEFEDPRHYIIHGDVTTDECAERMALWNIGCATQPLIMYVFSDFGEIVMGSERNARHMAPGLFLDAGGWVTISSDAPVTYPNWKQNVETAVLRESQASGTVYGPEYCITVEEAIIAVTLTGAYQDHMEDIKGSIEVGKLADLCILDEDILTIDPHDISDIPTLMTILGGEVVYDSGALSID